MINSRLIYTLLLALISSSAIAQVIQPAKWTVKTSETEVTEGDVFEIIFDVVIDRDWYLYSSDFDPDCGPTVTTFGFTDHPSFELVGEIEPIEPKEKYDEIFECDYTYFRGKGRFIQKVKALSGPIKIEGYYDYQVCTDVDGKCIPFDDDFLITEVVVKPRPKEPEPEQPKPSNEPEPGNTNPATEVDEDVSKVEAEEVLPNTAADTLEDNSTEVTETIEEPIAEDTSASIVGSRSSNDPYSLLAFMLFAFLAGLAAILTPCVFPMIPVTVTFFTSGSSTKGQAISKGLSYGLAIILIYTVIGVLVSMLFGAEVANDLATSATANLIFFAVFVLFGLSFLGLFEITLPSSWVNSVDKQADKGGLVGIIFMALVLVLVSFSCTGPIVGSILVESAGGQFVKPVLGMFAFSMAFAIPFSLFAIFPEWLSNLPKSGGWLNSVKVVLGFIELALSLKFLSIVDQVYHWGILDREVFLSIWIVILFLLGLYLLGKIKLPHDSDSKFTSVPRLILSIAVFSFVVYLIPGLFGAPLKALSGYLPPMTTHDFNLVELSQSGTAFTGEEDELCEEPLYADILEFPHGIKGYFDYDQAIDCAREQGKPLFIDFTGHGCVNCREMEARVWSDPAVLKRLKTDFVMVALYVDDRKELPEEDWYVSEYDGKTKKTIGKQNADLQITRFNNNAQPFYVILDHDENLLMQPKAYDLDVGNFVDFLDQALINFEKGQSLVSQEASN